MGLLILRTFRFQSQTPTIMSETIECPMPELHARIIQMAFSNFQRVDDVTRRALEPVFEGMLNSASDATVDYQDQRVVMAEKHEFKSQTNSIVSSKSIPKRFQFYPYNILLVLNYLSFFSFNNISTLPLPQAYRTYLRGASCRSGASVTALDQEPIINSSAA